MMQRKKRTTVPRFRLPYTPAQVYTMLYAACRAEVSSRYRQFRADEAYKQHLVEVADWLTGSQPSFGIFFCGSAGNGKTTIVRALQSVYHYIHSDEPALSHDTTDELQKGYVPGFSIITAKDLVRLAKAYNSPTYDNRADRTAYLHTLNVEILAIDDLGVEPSESMSYGDYVTAAKDILSYRYDRQLTTIATSNLAPSEIKDYYDERVADRLREMMLIVDFGNTPSFRTTTNK